MLIEDFQSWLKAQSGVSAFVSSRIYPAIPQNPTYPLILIEEDGEDRPWSFDGQGTYLGSDIQIHCFAETYAEAKNLSEAVKNTLLNYSGTMGSTTVDQVNLVSKADVYEQQVEKYRSSRDVTIWHYE